LTVELTFSVLLFVLWYCHKRGRETRLEKERLAADQGDTGHISSASSINGDAGDAGDADSIFGAKPKAVEGERGAGVASPPQEPLIIGDGKEDEQQSATVNDLPSVSHLPDPSSGEVPETATPSLHSK
jgi:hypothetical protein